MNTTTAIGVALLLIAAGAGANDASELETDTGAQYVSYDDLNLEQDADTRALYQRLRAAAQSACRAALQRQPLPRPSQWSCTRSALGDAVTKMNDHRLSALHSKNTRERAIQTIAASK